MTKSERKEALEAKIAETHDMQQVGQVWQWEACGVKGVDKCSICGLRQHWYSGGQNSPDHTDYYDARGNELTLAEAARLECA